jgi:hypothetical protein
MDLSGSDAINEETQEKFEYFNNIIAENAIKTISIDFNIWKTYPLDGKGKESKKPQVSLQQGEYHYAKKERINWSKNQYEPIIFY